MAAQPDHDAELLQGAQRARAGIEFGIADEADALDRLARQVARHDDLDLALHRFGIELLAGAFGVALAGARIEAVAILQQDARLAGIARRHDIDRDEGQAERRKGRADDPELAPLDRGPERRKVQHVAAAIAAIPHPIVGLSGHELHPSTQNWEPQERRCAEGNPIKVITGLMHAKRVDFVF